MIRHASEPVGEQKESTVAKVGNQNENSHNGVHSLEKRKDSIGDDHTDGDRDREGGGMSFSSITHKDAFLLFRALCKLSMKGLHDPDDTHIIPSDPIALQNK